MKARIPERECSGLDKGTIEVVNAVDEGLERSKADLIYSIHNIL